MTNVTATQLNYTKCRRQKYDRDIVNAIPFHEELHQEIAQFISTHFDRNKTYRILDLGVGTGITAALVKKLLPHAHLDVVDFSPRMLEHARKRLGYKNVSFILGDYSKIRLKKKYDMIISVIGIHHQNTTGKKKIFKKIYNLLSEHGVFVFGDLVTHRHPKVAALNHALHYHHLVNMTDSKKTLTDWAYHHLYLNDLTPIEDLEQWLKTIGYHVTIALQKMNTALLICQKAK